jgi:hypothetical protein
MARVINVDQPVDADQRLYGMMQHLMAAYADQQAPERPAPRGVVECQDALDAVIQLAAVNVRSPVRRCPKSRAIALVCMVLACGGLCDLPGYPIRPGSSRDQE